MAATGRAPGPGVAVVTGGSSGIGAGVVETLLSDESVLGCVVLDLAADGETESGNGHVRHLRCDVSDPEAVSKAFAQANGWLGPITRLVNCAGIAVASPSLELTPRDWHRVLSVHLDGTLYCSQAAGRLMVEAGGGAIVNLSSVAAHFGYPRRVAYSCAKAAIEALTRTLAVEWAEHGIRVNCVAPGFVNTPLVEDVIRRKVIDREFAEGLHAMRRFGAVEEVTEVIAFLASPLASFITGEVVKIDGGFSAMKFS